MLGSQYADTILSSDVIPIILDIDENSIGQIELELQTKYARGDFLTLNCDITDVDAVRQAKENILSKKPDIIIIATGGTPNIGNLDEGSDLACNTWDIISGNTNIEDDVILYDDNGAFAGLQTAEMIANKGSKLEIITPERFFSPEVGGMNYVPYAKTFIEKNVKITIDKRIKRIKKRGNRLLVSIGSDYSNILENLETSQVIIEHGTLPLDDLYFELKQKSYNLGAIDYNSLIKNKFIELKNNKEGSYFLYRVGDAISSRNIHAAIYDSLRICNHL